MISDELKNFLKNNEVENNQDWRDRISKVDPNWECIFKDSKNWKELENFIRPSDYDDLFKHQHGYGIDAIENISPDEWNSHSDKMKEYIIEDIFIWYPGEPFKTIRYIIRHMDPMGPIGRGMVIIPMSYIPSYKVRKLKELIEIAGDKKFLEYINKRIKERMDAFGQMSMAAGSNVSAMLSGSNINLRLLYQPTPYERELIAYLINFFKQERFKIIPLPDICLSYETPPLFLHYPELEPSIEEFLKSESNRDNKDNKIKTRQNYTNIRPEVISIEEVLGLYCPTPHPHIILYQKGIYWVSCDFDINIDQLRAVVLIHEIGHWIMHQLPHPIARQYDTELFKYTAEDLHECWAQLLTAWVAENKSFESFNDAFVKLNLHQRSAYKKFSDYLGYEKKDIIDSLIKLRAADFPASLNDWHNYCL